MIWINQLYVVCVGERKYVDATASRAVALYEYMHVTACDNFIYSVLLVRYRMIFFIAFMKQIRALWVWYYDNDPLNANFCKICSW